MKKWMTAAVLLALLSGCSETSKVEVYELKSVNNDAILTIQISSNGEDATFTANCDEDGYCDLDEEYSVDKVDNGYVFTPKDGEAYNPILNFEDGKIILRDNKNGVLATGEE